jgi:hypothetical protein
VDNAPEIAVQQSPKFKAEATELIGAGGIEAVAVYRIDHPGVGVVIPARIYPLRCYAKNVRTDLTSDERRELRQIAVHMKGAH